MRLPRFAYSTAACSIALSLAALILPCQAIAGRMLWSTVDTPSNQYGTITSPSELDFVAMSNDGRKFYVSDTASSRLYRSTDGGRSWLETGNNLTASGAVLPAWNITLAANNDAIIAAVTSTGGMPRDVFLSRDGGQSWTGTSFPGTANISCIAIAPGNGYIDIAAGTRSAGNGKIYICRTSSDKGDWIDQGFSGDVLALRFPADYRADNSLAVLYSTRSGTYFNTGVRDLSSNSTDWNTVYNSNPPEITSAGPGTSPTAGQIITGDLELPWDFRGQAPGMCRAYISIDSSGGSPGIYRLDNSVVYRLMEASGRRISSIAFFGNYLDGKLLAGEVSGDRSNATVVTWFTEGPVACPATCWYRAEKPASGAGSSGYANAQLLWSPDGSRAYCGTGSALLTNPGAWPAGYLNSAALDESAFSVSADNGKTWNQVSLIDTNISFLSDVALSTDASDAYLASINTLGPGLDSIWRSTVFESGQYWERVLCLPSATNDIILRTNSHGIDRSIFLASRGTSDLRQSRDGGQNWKAQLPGMTVNDFSVTTIGSAHALFILSGPYVRKADVSALVPRWSQQYATNLAAGHTVFVSPDNCVVVGGSISDSRVAFSTDGGSTFSVIPGFPEPGHIHAITDYRFSKGIIIYAASDNPGSNIYFWIPGLSQTWESMQAPTSGFWGLAQSSTLYGSSARYLLPVVDRTLSPEALSPPAMEWDMLDVGLPTGTVFTREPISLKLSAGGNLWAIDNRPYNYNAAIGRLWTYGDCLSPSQGYSAAPLPHRQPATTHSGTDRNSHATQGIIPDSTASANRQNDSSPPLTKPETQNSTGAITIPTGSNPASENVPPAADGQPPGELIYWISLVSSLLIAALIIVVIATLSSRRRI